MLKILLLIVLVIPAISKADYLNLLTIPMSDETTHTYSVDLKKQCSFEGVTEVVMPPIEKTGKENVIKDTLNTVQKEINLEIEDQKIASDKITFSLKGSKNISFEFTFDKAANCKLVKQIVINEDKRYKMNSMDIEYDHALSSPVMKKVIIKDENGKEVETLFPGQLQGQMGSYEFIFGPIFNIHTNIRLNNQKTFERTHPVVKPMPGFLFRYGPLFLNREGLGSLVYNNGEFTVLVMALLKGEAYEAGGMNDRKEGIFVGATLKYSFVQLIYFNDFFKDKGYNIKLNVAPSFHENLKWKFSPQAYVQYWDDKYADYYFGVTPEETARTGLRSYKAHHTLNYGTVFEINHFVDRFTYIAALGAKLYGDEIHSSPTVVKKNEARIILGVLYKLF